MATFGIQGNKRLGVDDDEAYEAIEEQQEEYPDFFMTFGYINEEGLLSLTPKCVDTIRSKFTLLNSNRINH